MPRKAAVDKNVNNNNNQTSPKNKKVKGPPAKRIKKEEDVKVETDEVEPSNGTMYVMEEVEEIVEHICAKCEKTFDNMEVLKAHLPQCRLSNGGDSKTGITKQEVGVENDPVDHYVLDIPNVVNSKIKIPEITDTTVVIDWRPTQKIVDYENDDDFTPVTRDEKIQWENHDDPDTCYCCGESHETAHTGHIRCKKCFKSFKDNESLRRHILINHSTKEKFPCEKCNAKLLSKKLLKLHKEAHNIGKQFCCKGCGKEFTRKYHLTRHLKHLNCDGTRPVIKHPCNVCGNSFARLDILKDHLRSHIDKNSQPRKDFECPYCPKAFAGSSLLNIHIRTHTGERPFVCDICKNGFPSNGALRKHRRTHTGEKPYQCTFCPSKFAAKETLNRHTKTHTGEKKYACGNCDARFIQNSQLKAHMKNHDASISWDCKVCNQKFDTVRLLHIHHRNEHKMGKIYTCNYCNNNYITKAELKRHMEGIHLGLRKFGCSICSKKFVTKGQLDIHSHIHSIEDPVRCKLCNRYFRRKDCYKRHIRARHKEYFERAIQIAEMKKLCHIDGNVANIEIIPEQEEAFILTNEPVEYDINTVEEGEVFEFIIPEDLENQFMEPTAVDENQETIRQDHTFSSLIEFIATVKVEPSLNEEDLIIYTKKLLTILLDATTLENFGYPKKPVVEILSGIIENCGGNAFQESDADPLTLVRENVKLFFTLVMESDQITTLLNNHTVDEVVQFVIKYLQSD